MSRAKPENAAAYCDLMSDASYHAEVFDYLQRKTEIAMTTPMYRYVRFRIGDKCRRSDLGRRRNPKRRRGPGKVVSFGITSRQIRVRFASCRSTNVIHASNSEHVPETPGAKLTYGIDQGIGGTGIVGAIH